MKQWQSLFFKRFFDIYLKTLESLKEMLVSVKASRFSASSPSSAFLKTIYCPLFSFELSTIIWKETLLKSSSQDSVVLFPCEERHKTLRTIHRQANTGMDKRGLACLPTLALKWTSCKEKASKKSCARENKKGKKGRENKCRNDKRCTKDDLTKQRKGYNSVIKR